MQTREADDWATVVIKMAAYILAWLGSWTLAEVQQLAGILSGLVVMGVGILNGYLLWRDRISAPRRRGGKNGRAG